MTLRFLTAFVTVVLFSFAALANNMKVSNVTVTGKNTGDHTAYIQFNLSWENSWRVSSAPNNWDAAWVFAKFKVAGGTWKHVYISTDSLQHSVVNNNGTPVYFSVKKPEPSWSQGTGCLIYRAQDGTGTMDLQQVKIKWNYGANSVNDTATVSVQVYAIEMVYIPEGSFELGSPGGSEENHFFQAGNPNSAFLVTSSQIYLGNDAYTKLWATGNISTGMVAPGYPTGYKSFYSMKYSLTQGQLVDYLNTLTRTQQQSNFPGVNFSGLASDYKYVLLGTQIPENRYGICLPTTFQNTTDPVTFSCDLNNNGIFNEFNDGASLMVVGNFSSVYAEWSGLRAISEMEFEKVCRGPLPAIANERVNSTQNWYPFLVSNAGSDSEKVSSFGTEISQFDAYRSGIFADNSTNRIQAWAGYYGCMDLQFYFGIKCIQIINSSSPVIIKNGTGDLLANGGVTNTNFNEIGRGRDARTATRSIGSAIRLVISE